MKPSLTHATPTVAATLAAATIALSVFLLPGAGIQSGPTPLLPTLGAASGGVAANLPPVARTRAARPVTKAASAPLSSRPTTPAAAQRRATVTKAPPVHHRARTRHVRRTVVASVAAATPAPAARPVTRRLVGAPPGSRGKARGHAHAAKPPLAAPGRRAHGHGKAVGRSHGPGGGHVKHAPAASSPAPAAPGANGAGTGPKRGKK